MTTSPMVPMDKAQHNAVPALNWDGVPAVAAKLSHTPGIGGLAMTPTAAGKNPSLTTLKVTGGITIPLGIILLIVSANREAPSGLGASAAALSKFASETLQMAGAGVVLLMVGIVAVLLSIAVDAVLFRVSK